LRTDLCLAQDVAHRITVACMPGSFLVDVFPVMKYLPEAIAPWKKEGMEWHRRDTAMFQELMDEVKNQMVGSFLFLLDAAEHKHE
jgi:hypothetical protein